MRKIIDEPHLLVEFLQEQPSYSPDFKALILRLLDQQPDVARVSELTLVPARTLYTWLAEWNQAKKKPSSTNPRTAPGGDPA